MPTYDVVVAGLGGYGSSAAAHLAARGLRTLGLDPRPGAHAEGSSHGESRIVRQVYFEGAAYVPLLRRAYELWADLTEESGEPLLRRTGGLFLGLPHTRVFRGSLDTARQWDLEHAVLDGAELQARFPALRPPDGVVGLWEPQAGTVRPESAVAAQLRRAAAAGAELRHDEAVTGWAMTGDGVHVTTSRGSYDAGALVLAPGKWVPELLAGLDLPLTVERRVQHWFAPPDVSDFLPGRLPVWIWDRADGTSMYGVPSQGTDGDVKAAVHFSTVRPADAWSVEEVAGTLAELFPGLGDRHVREAACWYTLTPDENFVVGPHPEAPRVLLACGFSGHGFKFTPVLGEALADLVADGSTRHDLSTFDPRRFSGVRLFVAVRPPEQALEHAAAEVAVVRAVQDGPRWIPPERWHLTLAFYGEVPDADVDAVRDRLDRRVRGTADLSLALVGAGAFSRRAVWLGVSGDVGPLRALARLVALDRSRPYRPHLTVARLRGDTDPTAAVAALSSYVGPVWPAGSVHLVRSHLGPAPTYDDMASWPLATRS